MNTKSILPILAAIISMTGFQAHAVQGAATAIMKVTTAIQVNKTSDLVFNEAGAGAAAETIAPGTAEDANNASFAIVGEPNRAITTTLPLDGTVVMFNPLGSGVDAEIPVNQFTGSAPGTLDGSGNATLFVGATRETLTASQLAGDYEGDFVVDVVYQ